jgi:hypothetical protein
VLHAAQLVALLAVLYSPAAHAVHVWSLVALPALDTYVPAAHAVQATHCVASALVLNVPLAQLAHT